ncbi:hypothetical protein J3R03_005894 [Actinoplanes couchii]|uniref:CN hydrolase domain-containing protein n=1 Tax=Actinoplanes couchii TaxID=403638 RepID=A0ABQ3XFT8_9ACTN|nr:hypothetical protein [Actinoplanes couchii]MDR6321698.1 hypothetical protein [Actinoplanes couchii]GID57346.1 hypothetical protein Aco03nite_057500 [Actinoplanes couchii]
MLAFSGVDGIGRTELSLRLERRLRGESPTGTDRPGPPRLDHAVPAVRLDQHGSQIARRSGPDPDPEAFGGPSPDPVTRVLAGLPDLSLLRYRVCRTSAALRRFDEREQQLRCRPPREPIRVRRLAGDLAWERGDLGGYRPPFDEPVARMDGRGATARPGGQGAASASFANFAGNGCGIGAYRQEYLCHQDNGCRAGGPECSFGKRRFARGNRMPGLVRVAGARIEIGPRAGENLAACVRVIDVAAERGARLVVLPEFGNHPSWHRSREQAWEPATRPGDTFRADLGAGGYRRPTRRGARRRCGGARAGREPAGLPRHRSGRRLPVAVGRRAGPMRRGAPQ